MEDRRPVLALFDLDGTLTGYDTFRAYLLAWLARHPARWPAGWRLAHALWQFKREARDNGWLKEQFLIALLGGAMRRDIEQFNVAFIDRLLAGGLRPGARASLATHRAHGDRRVLLSASPDLYVSALAARLAIPEVLCTAVEWDGDHTTGRLAGPNCRGAEKCRRIEAHLAGQRAAWHIVAYGDHASDLELLGWADEGVLVNPDQALARAARGRGLRVANW